LQVYTRYEGFIILWKWDGSHNALFLPMNANCSRTTTYGLQIWQVCLQGESQHANTNCSKAGKATDVKFERQACSQTRADVTPEKIEIGA